MKFATKPTHADDTVVLEDFEAIGPEFALVGVHDASNNAPRWIVALQSSVTQPWTSSEIKVVFSSAGEEFKKYERAMAFLIGSTKRR
jgi:hypothetical protein